jgi:hypothetical protein
MYSTCIFCHGALGGNESIEHFPVGRRLAFDAEKGRLWAVCTSCGRWNLSALEERWEAIEECERRFRGTSIRTSTENIGLARLRDGTELVRVGRPLRPEFAAWRYGAQFGGRQKRRWLLAASLGGIALGAGAGVLVAPAAALAGLPVLAAAEWKRRGLPRAPRLRDTLAAERMLRDDTGALMLTDGRAIERVRLRPDHDREEGRAWSLHVRTARGAMGGGSPENPEELPLTGGAPPNTYPVARDYVLTGSAALRALAVLMARANAAGAAGGRVQRAVAMIERARDPERFLSRAEEEARSQGAGYRDVWNMPLEIRLALEMAAHEDAERRALQGELAELEQHWREAEELAAIADALPLSPAMDEKLDALRAGRAEWARRMEARREP